MSLLNAELKRLNSKQGVKFKTGFMNLGAKKLMTPDVLLIMRNEQHLWKLDYKLYQTYQFEKIFEFMTDNNAVVLLFNDNCRPSIVRQMRDVYFHELIELNLSRNNLVTIDNLLELQVPKLAKLDLSLNQITIIRSLNRMLNNLTVLRLQQNPIMDIDKLTRCSFRGLRELELESKSKQPVIGESLVWLIRSPTPHLISLRCCSRRRIKQHWMFGMLGQRYPRGKMALH